MSVTSRYSDTVSIGSKVEPAQNAQTGGHFAPRRFHINHVAGSENTFVT